MKENLIGEQFGSYRLIRHIGRGGFADVYLAQHLRLSMQAAIKILNTRLSDEDTQSFHREAETIATLVYPGIVRVLDYDIKNGLPFLVLEYAPNGSLRQRHPKGVRVPPAMIVQYVKQVGEALQYAHEQKVIHRDVKPENMLLGRRNEVLLTDFGIATMVQNTSSVDVDMVAGSLPYVAPEQLQKHPHFASDQYALGIVVYEWLSGERPFQGSFTEVAIKHMTVPPPPLHARYPDITPEVEQVVMTALAKEPRQRFGSIRAFVNALEQASHVSPTGAPYTFAGNVAPHYAQPITPLLPVMPVQSVEVPPGVATNQGAMDGVTMPMAQSSHLQQTPPMEAGAVHLARANVETPPTPALHEAKTEHEPGSEPARAAGKVSRRGALIGLGAVAVLAAGGGVAWWAFSPHLPYVYRGHNNQVWTVAWSPDGSRIVSGGGDATKSQADNSSQVWNPLNGSRISTFTQHKDGVGSLSWSPDSQRVASSSFQNVFIWEAATGRLLAHQEDQVSNPMRNVALAWSPNGMTIVTGRENGVVQVRDAGAQVQAQFRIHNAVINAVAWSPDSQRVASASNDGTVKVWNVADGRIAFTLAHNARVNAVAWSPDGKRIASGSSDHIVHIWDAQNGGALHEYTTHTGAIFAVAWSPDSKMIASGSADTTVRVWNVTDSAFVTLYQNHSQRVTAVSWLPTWSIYGQLIASGSLDGTVQVWKV